MQTALTDETRATAAGEEANRILRSCVHCGFCTATCPTYQVTGDELDGPRGRIYLIKNLLEGREATRETQLHLDRCLGCRACETTCPSGVPYHRLLDIGRQELERKVPRPAAERLARRTLRALVPNTTLFNTALRLGQTLRPALPEALAETVPQRIRANGWPLSDHPRRMLLLESCAQNGATPATNAAAARVLDRLGIRLERVPSAGCCGALAHHLDAAGEARALARRNIDAWLPRLDAGAEAVLVTASGCGTSVKEYGDLLADDPHYREPAARVAAAARDLSEVVAAEADGHLEPRPQRTRVAFHCPCSLQHGQGLAGVVERLLTRAGYRLSAVADPHLCCGSAGPYALLQRDMATELRRRKLGTLEANCPEVIATANVGCQLHLQAGTSLPVRHWIELLDEAMAV